MTDVKAPAARRYAGQTGEARTDERRRALLEAAFTLVAQRGWAALRIDALCREAGLNKRYFYESFANLDTVAEALVAGLAEQVIAVTVATVAADLSPEEATRRTITTFVHHLTDDPRRARVLFGAIPPGQAAARHRQAAVRQVVAAAASVGQGIHDVPASAPVRVAASMLVGGTSQVIVDWLDGEIAAGRDELIDQLVGIWQVVGAEAARQTAAG